MKKIISVISCTLALSSCYQDIDLSQYQESPVVVLNCLANSDTTLLADISTTWPYTDSKKIEEFSVLQIYGEVSEGTINGSEASPDVLKKRFESLPSGEALIAYFRDVENKNN